VGGAQRSRRLLHPPNHQNLTEIAGAIIVEAGVTERVKTPAATGSNG